MKKILILLFIISLTVSQAQKKPNIVLFVADDLGAIDIPLYGNPEVRTPNIDSLAKQSMMFTNAFASSPTCSPSRASLLTGLMPFRNGAHENHAGIKEGIITLPSYLKNLGYRTAIAGKYHIGPSDSYPFEMIHGTNVAEPGHEGDGVLWTDLKIGPIDSWLSDFEVKKETPFLLVVNDHSPHVFWPETSTYNPDDIKIPSKHIDTKETKEARAKYYTDITKMDSNLGQLINSLKVHNLMDNTIFIFTSDQGPQWAFGKWSLYDYGIRVPLLIKWPNIIREGSDTDALISLVDITPTLIEAAGGKVPKEPSMIDGESFLSLLQGKAFNARENVYATHTGDGTMNPTPIRMVRNMRYKYILNLAPDVRYTTHMDKAKRNGEGGDYWPSWITKSFEDEHAASVLYRYHVHPKEELYDIQLDPNERVNLASEKAYKDILGNLQSKMNTWRKQQGDFEIGAYIPSTEKKEGIPYIFD